MRSNPLSKNIYDLGLEVPIVKYRKEFKEIEANSTLYYFLWLSPEERDVDDRAIFKKR